MTRRSHCRLVRCDVGATAAAWSAIGLSFFPESSSDVSSVHRGVAGDVEIVLNPSASGFVSCTFVTDAAMTATDAVTMRQSLVDGMPIHVENTFAEHLISGQPTNTDPAPFVVKGIDHVVVMTDDLQRTSDAVDRALGVPCARVRDAGAGVTQGFHKLDNTIIEIVTGPHVRTSGAHLWGFVITVDDIDAWHKYVGDDVASMPRPAVQPGRQIATVRESAGLGIAVAVMSPHVKPSES